jgi:SagB-type dehydrogenase family enzyme
MRELAETIRLRGDAQVSRDDGRWLVARRGYQLRLPPLPPSPDELVDQVLHLGVASDALAGRLGRPEPAGGRTGAVSALGRLRAGGWLQRSLALDGQPLITVRPVVRPERIVRRVLTGASVVRLSRFSYVRVGESGCLTVAAPTAREQVIVHDPRFLCLLQTLAAPLAIAEVQRAHGALLSERMLGHVLLTLLGLGLLVEVPASGPAADSAGSLAVWDFEELLFHSYSREGRADVWHGATYRKATPASAPPAAVAAPASPRVVELPPPATSRSGAAMQRVLEARRSTRDYTEDHPIDLRSLSAFLRKACGAAAGSGRRPYPGAGGLYELQVYPIVRRCGQLEPAVYRYDTRAHRLALIAPYDVRAAALLRNARQAMAMGSDPQVLLVITARFTPVMRKYDAIAYSLILKDVGVLFQTLYLVATQLRLGCCAVGNGNADLFAEICGHDFYEESSVGEFVIGRPNTTTGPIHTRR